MKVIVFGATGGTGRALLGALSSGGHQASAFARDPAKLRGIGGIGTVTGDVMQPADVAAAISGHDAVIVSLGNSQNPFGLLLGARRWPSSCSIGSCCGSRWPTRRGRRSWSRRRISTGRSCSRWA